MGQKWALYHRRESLRAPELECFHRLPLHSPLHLYSYLSSSQRQTAIALRWYRPLLWIEGLYSDHHIRLPAFGTRIQLNWNHVLRMLQTSWVVVQALFPPDDSSAVWVFVWESMSESARS
jgi:hypothetical protein